MRAQSLSSLRYHRTIRLWHLFGNSSCFPVWTWGYLLQQRHFSRPARLCRAERQEQFFSTKSLHETTSPQDPERSISARARAFGIAKPEQLFFESNVGHSYNLGSRLVDRTTWRDNLDFW